MSFRRRTSEPRLPEWCSEEHFPGLPALLEQYGGSLRDTGEEFSFPNFSSQEFFPPPVDNSKSPESELDNFFPTPNFEEAHSSPVSPGQQPTRRFAPKVERIFEPFQVPQDAFDCVVCGPSRLTHTAPPKSVCQHYISCSECQARIIHKLLRCGKCCRELTSQYPTCGPECETLSNSFGQMLQTANCPRCGDKLAKETCNSACDRKKSEAYKRCQDRLMKEVAALVLHPEECARRFPGARPCCHYARCEIHGKITRGRSRRCSGCRTSSRTLRARAGTEVPRRSSFS